MNGTANSSFRNVVSILVIITLKLLLGNWTSFHLCNVLDFFGTGFVSTCKSNTLNYMYNSQQHCTRKQNVTCLMDHFKKKSQASVKKSFEKLTAELKFLPHKQKEVCFCKKCLSSFHHQSPLPHTSGYRPRCPAGRKPTWCSSQGYHQTKRACSHSSRSRHHSRLDLNTV